MSKKDFDLIAKAVRNSKQLDLEGLDSAYVQGREDGLRDVATSLANALATTNFRFQRKRFLIACGAQDGQAYDSAGRRVNY